MDAIFNFRQFDGDRPKGDDPKLKEIVRKKYPDCDQILKDECEKGIFILNEGALERYLNLETKGLSHVINFCSKIGTGDIEDDFEKSLLDELKKYMNLIIND